MRQDLQSKLADATDGAGGDRLRGMLPQPDLGFPAGGGGGGRVAASRVGRSVGKDGILELTEGDDPEEPLFAAAAQRPPHSSPAAGPSVIPTGCAVPPPPCCRAGLARARWADVWRLS